MDCTMYIMHCKKKNLLVTSRLGTGKSVTFFTVCKKAMCTEAVFVNL